MKKNISQKGQEHLQKELERVKNLNNSNARDSILEFGRYLNRQQKSARRQLFLIQKLRVMQRDVEDGIIPLTDEKVVRAIDWVLENYQETETINGFRTALKQFYRFSVSNEIPGELIELLRYRKDRKHKLESSDLVTEDELEQLIDNCYNSRDKALFSTLYDGGMRHGEILEIRNKHVVFDDETDGGVKLIVPKTEKTSTRTVIIPKNGISIPCLREWEKDHPRRNDPEAYFFCRIEHKNRGEKIQYQDLNRIMNSVIKRAGITKRIYPHLLRHTRASIYASKVAQRPLEMQMGWVPGTSMLATYAHLNVKDQEEAILRANGIVKEVREDKNRTPVKCPRCSEVSDYRSRFCWKCGFTFGTDDKKEREIVTEAIKQSDFVSEDAKELLDPDNLKGLAKLLIKIEKNGQLDKLIELADKLK